MATVLDLVTDALYEIGVLAAGETAGAGEGASALRTLNRLINAWKAERVYIYKTTRTTWAVVSGTSTYTVGTGGTVNVLRPLHIDAVTVLDTSVTPNVECPPLRQMTDADYAALRVKTQTSYRPVAFWYQANYPLANLIFWPVPTSTTLTGVMYAPEAAAEFAALSTAVSLPPGYERLIVKNLAQELAPSYGARVSPELKEQARDALAVVLRSNRRLQEMQFAPEALMKKGLVYDIYSDNP